MCLLHDEEFKPFLLLIKIVLTSFLIPTTSTTRRKKKLNEILRTQNLNENSCLDRYHKGYTFHFWRELLALMKMTKK